MQIQRIMNRKDKKTVLTWKVKKNIKWDTCPHCGRTVMVDWDENPMKTYWGHDIDTVSRVFCPRSHTRYLPTTEL